MKKTILALAVVGFLVGCGGGGGSSVPSNGGSGTPLDDGEIFNEPKSRGVSHLFGKVEDINLDGKFITNYTISKNGKYLYATTLNTRSKSEIYVFSRDAESGKLTKIQSLEANDIVSGKEPLFSPHGIVVSPDGKQIYISASFGVVSDDVVPFGSNLLRFDVADSGQISYNSSLFVSDGYDPQYNVQITDDGDLMYIGSNGTLVSVISRASNGDIGLLSEIKKDINDNKFENTRYLTLSPDKQNLYASSSFFDGHLYVFDAVSVGLTSKETFVSNDDYIKNGDQRVSGAGGTGMDISKDGKFFYSVGGYGDAKDSISIFGRDSEGGLAYLKSVQAPISEDNSNRILYSADAHMIVSPNQKYIYTYDHIIEVLGVWKRDANSGDLNYLGQIKIDTNHAGKLIPSADGKHLYVNVADGFASYDLRADMHVQVTSSATSVKPSEDFSYTLTVTNHGPSNGDDVIITDTLPAGVTYLSSSIDAPGGSCEVDGQVVTCHIGTLFTSGLYHVTINVLAPEVEGDITNKATVVSNQLDTKIANNSSLVKTNIKEQ